MKIINILFLIICIRSSGQDYVANWVTVPKETGMVNYQVQKSIDNINWITIATISPKKGIDSNKYSYTLSGVNSYIRIKALMTKATVYTSPTKLVNTNVYITNAILKINASADNLRFTAINEAAVSYYSIERNNNSSPAWVIVGKLTQANKRNYVVNITKIGLGRIYRLRAVYNNNDLKTAYITFDQ